MNPVFSREGGRALAASWVGLVLAVVLGAAIVAGSRWYLERERRENLSAERRLQEKRAAVEALRREHDSLQESAEVFRTLVDRGLLGSERRLELVEMVNGLRSHHQLFSLDYEIAPQRPLAFSGGRVFSSVDVLASRVRLRARALHEGDVISFVQSLTESRQGFYPVDRCVMRRLDASSPDALQPRIEADCTLEWITLKEKRGTHGG